MRSPQELTVGYFITDYILANGVANKFIKIKHHSRSLL